MDRHSYAADGAGVEGHGVGQGMAGVPYQGQGMAAYHCTSCPAGHKLACFYMPGPGHQQAPEVLSKLNYFGLHKWYNFFQVIISHKI